MTFIVTIVLQGRVLMVQALMHKRADVAKFLWEVLDLKNQGIRVRA